MSHLSKRCLSGHRGPSRSIFIAFLSLFAMDVFSEHLGLWRTALALTMHSLIPSFVLIAALIWLGGGSGSARRSMPQPVCFTSFGSRPCRARYRQQCDSSGRFA